MEVGVIEAGTHLQASLRINCILLLTSSSKKTWGCLDFGDVPYWSSYIANGTVRISCPIFRQIAPL